MWTVGIIEMNHLLNCQIDLSKIHEAGIQSIFGFQDTDKTFCEDIVVAIADGSHAGINIVIEQGIHVSMVGVLNTMVRVVDQIGNITGAMRQSHLQAA